MPSVNLAGVSKTYPGGVVGLHPTDLALDAGDRLALLGPSGSGKSTLLRLVAGLDDPDAGTVHIGGVRVDRVPPHRRGVGMVAQRPALYPHLTVEQNIAAATSSALITHHSSLITQLCGPLLSRYPHQLSGGEKQRVALAKLIARGAGVWLLDEPFAGLDPMFRAEFRADLHLLLESTRATMIVVTHDPNDAWALGRRVGVLGDGRLQQLGTPDELHARPDNRFVAACLGRLSLIDGQVAPSGGRAGGGGHSERTFVSACGSVSVPLPAGLARLGTDRPYNLTLGIRPEDASLVSPGEPPNPNRSGVFLTGWPVVSAEPVGSGWFLTLARGRTRFRAWQPSGTPPPVGRPVDSFLPADRCLWFDGPTGRRIGE
jgi:ABC-type sugar transport system ATPase subunit